MTPVDRVSRLCADIERESLVQWTPRVLCYAALWWHADAESFVHGITATVRSNRTSDFVVKVPASTLVCEDEGLVRASGRSSFTSSATCTSRYTSRSIGTILVCSLLTAVLRFVRRTRKCGHWATLPAGSGRPTRRKASVGTTRA